MSNSAVVRTALEPEFGPIEECSPVSGGSIAAAFRLRLASGKSIFVKLHDEPGVLAAEVDGLARLGTRAPEAIAVPEVLGAGTLDNGAGWLALPWVETAPADASVWKRFGRALAELHSTGYATRWGLEVDNWIGPLPQSNTPAEEWAEFWWEHRLEPQLRLAEGNGYRPGDAKLWRSLEAVMPERLAAAKLDGPSLLHGDLWSGNVLTDPGGRGWLIDPAAYHGHREVDLAMADLFGGFPDPFWEGYGECNPLQPGFQSERKPIYQLYYLLVHVNLFGSAYVGRTDGVLRQALSVP